MRAFVFIFGVLLLSCNSQHNESSIPDSLSSKPGSMGTIADTLCVYMPQLSDGKTFYTAVPLSSVNYPVTRLEALNLIGKRLSETYFAQYGEREIQIHFSVDTIQALRADKTSQIIALISIHDPQQVLGKTFFQGSAGGQATYNVLTASFLQPQMDQPLLDAVAFTINGVFPLEMDHIDLSGIQVEELLAPQLKRLVYRR